MFFETLFEYLINKDLGFVAIVFLIIIILYRYYVSKAALENELRLRKMQSDLDLKEYVKCEEFHQCQAKNQAMFKEHTNNMLTNFRTILSQEVSHIKELLQAKNL